MKPRRARSPEDVARRKAAWAKVGRDVFPLWSNPRSATNPFRRWDDWSDDGPATPVSTPTQLPVPAAGHDPSARPGPGSPFFVAPASDAELRRLLVILCVSPALLLAVAIAALVRRQWGSLAFSVALLLTYGVLKGVQIRAVARELSRRRSAHR